MPSCVFGSFISFNHRQLCFSPILVAEPGLLRRLGFTLAIHIGRSAGLNGTDWNSRSGLVGLIWIRKSGAFQFLVSTLQTVATGGLCHFVRAMATYVDRKEQVATWDGNQSHWLDYVKRVRLQYERTPYKKRQYLGAELVTRLTGKAWDVASADIDHDRLQEADGPAYLLQFLEQRLCKAPIPDSGQRLEDFFIRLRRVPGASMTEWATQVRETYRRLQRALARQRFEARPVVDEKKKEESVAGSHRSAQSLLRTPESRRRRSDVTSPRAYVSEDTERRMRDDEVAAERRELPGEETVRSRARDAEAMQQDQEEEQASVHTGSQPSHWHEQWSAEEWADWHAWRREESDSSTLEGHVRR